MHTHPRTVIDKNFGYVKLIPLFSKPNINWELWIREVYGSQGTYFNWSHPDVFSLKYSKSKFSQNTNNLLSIITIIIDNKLVVF